MRNLITHQSIIFSAAVVAFVIGLFVLGTLKTSSHSTNIPTVNTTSISANTHTVAAPVVPDTQDNKTVTNDVTDRERLSAMAEYLNTEDGGDVQLSDVSLLLAYNEHCKSLGTLTRGFLINASQYFSDFDMQLQMKADAKDYEKNPERFCKYAGSLLISFNRGVDSIVKLRRSILNKE